MYTAPKERLDDSHRPTSIGVVQEFMAFERAEDASSTLKLATPGLEFAGDLVQLWRTTFQEAYSDVHSAADIETYCRLHFTRATAAKALTSPNTVCLIAYRGDTPVGLAIVVHRSCPIQLEADSSELKHLYIRNTEYGRRTGITLLIEAERVILDNQRRWIWLTVADSNARAKRFYTRKNFTTIGPGPQLEVGTDILASTLMAKPCRPRHH